MAERFLAWFKPCTPTPRVRGALNRVWGASAASTVRLGKKTKVVGKDHLRVADHIFGTLIQIWKDLGPMCFCSHGQLFSGKAYKTKVAVNLPNSKVGQVLTPTSVPLPLPRVESTKKGLGNFEASNYPHSCE